MKNVPILIPQGDPESLRRQITQQVNKLKTQVANSSQRTEPMDLGHNRITSVSDPGAPTDAVNLRTLKKAIDGITQQHVQRKQGSTANLYGVVFSNAGAAVAGSGSPPYIILPNRSGTPVVVRAAALVAPSGTPFVFNVGVIPFGSTTTTNLILAANGTLTAGANGPVTFTNFQPNTKFNDGDMLVPVVATSGSAGSITIEVEIQP